MNLVKGLEWEDVIDTYFHSIRNNSKRLSIATRDLVDDMIDREWPEQRKPPPTFDPPPATMLQMTGGGTPRDFFKDDEDGGKPAKNKGKIARRFRKNK
jgi:hypothetical protein